MAGERFAQIPDETGIQFIAAGFRRVLRGPATSQVERLIAADIEGLRTEQRRVFLNQARGEIMGLGIGGVQRVMFHAFDEAERAVGVFGELTQPAMLTGAQIHVHVPERGQRRHQLDAATRAVLVQVRDVVGRERIGAAPRLAELDEREGMLVLDMQAGNGTRGLPDDLPQRLQTVSQPALAAATHANALRFGHIQRVFVMGQP